MTREQIWLKVFRRPPGARRVIRAKENRDRCEQFMDLTLESLREAGEADALSLVGDLYAAATAAADKWPAGAAARMLDRLVADLADDNTDASEAVKRRAGHLLHLLISVFAQDFAPPGGRENAAEAPQSEIVQPLINALNAEASRVERGERPRLRALAVLLASVLGAVRRGWQREQLRSALDRLTRAGAGEYDDPLISDVLLVSQRLRLGTFGVWDRPPASRRIP